MLRGGLKFFQKVNRFDFPEKNENGLNLRGVEWVHGLFLFPLVLGKMTLPHAKLGLFCVVKIINFIKT